MDVLIVDDSVVFRSQIKSALADCPEVDNIEIAANGKIALSKMERLSFDLIILDLQMPEMNGIETLKEMKARSITTHTIVFSSLTARGADSTLEALEQGANDFVTKLLMYKVWRMHWKESRTAYSQGAQFQQSNARQKLKMASGSSIGSPSASPVASVAPTRRCSRRKIGNDSIRISWQEFASLVPRPVVPWP